MALESVANKRGKLILGALRRAVCHVSPTSTPVVLQKPTSKKEMSAAARAEARRKAILSRGSDRLAKLTTSARGEDAPAYMHDGV